MRVVHLLEALEPGGLERTAIDLAAAQRGLGLRSEIYCIFEPGRLAPDAEAFGVPVNFGAKRLGFDLAWLRRFRAHALREPATVVHAHNPVANYLASASLLGTNVPVVFTAHDLGHRFASRKVRSLFRLALCRTSRLAAVSDASRNAYQELGIARGRSIAVIYNGVPLPELPPAHVREQMRRELLGVSDADVVYGSVGRLVPVKNHALLIDAFERLCRRSAAARLAIVGDGPLRDGLAATVQARRLGERVHFLGFRSDARALATLFDVYVQSSDSEGHSIALLEAAGAALPLVATDVGGNGAIVHPGLNGLLVPPGDVTALSEAMSVFLDVQLRRQHAESSRGWAAENASIRAAASRYVRLYEEARRSGN